MLPMSEYGGGSRYDQDSMHSEGAESVLQEVELAIEHFAPGMADEFIGRLDSMLIQRVDCSREEIQEYALQFCEFVKLELSPHFIEQALRLLPPGEEYDNHRLELAAFWRREIEQSEWVEFSFDDGQVEVAQMMEPLEDGTFLVFVPSAGETVATLDQLGVLPPEVPQGVVSPVGSGWRWGWGWGEV